MCILTNRFSCWIPCCDAFLGLRSPDVFGYGSDSRHKHLCFLSAEQFLRCSLQGKNISPNSSHCDLDANLHPNHSKSAGAGCTSLRFFQLLARNSLWKRNPIRHLFQESKISTLIHTPNLQFYKTQRVQGPEAEHDSNSPFRIHIFVFHRLEQEKRKSSVLGTIVHNAGLSNRYWDMV